MSREALQTPAIDLHRIEPGRNMARFYHAALWPDLFGGVTLAREWGRIGRPGELRLDAYSDPAAAEAALDKLVRQKQRKGYHTVAQTGILTTFDKAATVITAVITIEVVR